MRTRTVAVLALMLAFGPGACARTADPQVASARNDAAAQPSASTEPTHDPDAPLKFAQCMREHGMTWFPDPTEGRNELLIPKGTDPQKFEAAQEACKKYAPDGGDLHKPSAEDLKNARDMAKCMRENGIPNFPDPSPDGRMSIDSKKLGTGPGQPLWDKAEKACARYLPKNGQKQSRSDSGGGTTGNQGPVA